MNEKQVHFLSELAELCNEYDIEEMYINDAGMISFDSNGESLHFKYYDGELGIFKGVVTVPGDHTVKREG